jgi:hypothetical protein
LRGLEKSPIASLFSVSLRGLGKTLIVSILSLSLKELGDSSGNKFEDSSTEGHSFSTDNSTTWQSHDSKPFHLVMSAARSLKQLC